MNALEVPSKSRELATLSVVQELSETKCGRDVAEIDLSCVAKYVSDVDVFLTLNLTSVAPES